MRKRKTPCKHSGGGNGSREAITILMADDDPDDRQLTREAFEEAKLPKRFALR